MISNDVLRRILTQQEAQRLPNKGMIPREIFNEIHAWLDDPRILIFTGLRRSGKSTLMQQLIQSNPKSSYVNFEDERFLEFQAQDFEQLHEVILEQYGEIEFYFFDEIQNIDRFETFIRRLHDQRKKIIITGSNASLLSSEFGTRLTGRYKSFEVFPFSFSEFLRFHHITPTKEWLHLAEKRVILLRHFNTYLTRGGMPEYLQNNDDEYIRTVYENILYRDIIARYHIKKQKILKELVNLLATQISCQITYNSLKESLGLSNAITVKEYISYLQNSYLFFEVQQFEYSLKKQLNAPKKIYVVDPVFHRICGMTASPNKGHLLENIVFLELKRKKQNIYYFEQKHQCDFILKKDAAVHQVIQVCYHLDEGNKRRELQGLQEAMDTFRLQQGLLLTYEQEDVIKSDGKTIQVIPVWKWLLASTVSNQEQ